MCACGYVICSINVFFPGLPSWLEKCDSSWGFSEKRTTRILEDERMKPCSNSESTCLLFIFSSQAGVGSDQGLKQREKDQSTEIKEEPSNELGTLCRYFPLLSIYHHHGSLRSLSVSALEKKKAFLFLAILFVCFFFGGTSSLDLTKTLKNTFCGTASSARN